MKEEDKKYDVEMHYTNVKEHVGWPWRNFMPQEIACHSDGLIKVNKQAMDSLQKLRDLAGTPIVINSGYRSEVHNRKVGGAPHSQHMLGKAFDIRITKAMPREKIHELAKKAGFTGFGDYNTFVHVDVGPTRYWDLRK